MTGGEGGSGSGDAGVSGGDCGGGGVQGRKRGLSFRAGLFSSDSSPSSGVTSLSGC